jgi:hypothetical protein
LERLSGTLLAVVGRLRVARKKPCKAWVYALASAAGLLLASAPAYAKGEHVQNRCPRLTSAEYDELDARVLLLVESEGAGGLNLPAVVCTRKGAWVQWGEERVEIVGRGSLVDEVVDIVEARLHDAERKADADPKTAEDSAVAAGQPMLERGGGAPPAPPPTVQRARMAVRPADARGGGIAAGFETELVSDDLGPAMGPAFDFANSAGPLVIGGREAFRFTATERQMVFMDFEGLIGYGAPFNPDAHLGGVVRFGAEWMVAYPQGNAGQSAVAPVVALGFRVAHNFGLVGLWFGIDSRLRLSRLNLQSGGASDVTGSFTLGIAFVDWSRK